jgi:hypothetical protein
MKKTLKASAIVFLGLIIWIVISYIALAFLKAESNPFVWSQSIRGALLISISFYFCFVPLMIHSLKNEM